MSAIPSFAFQNVDAPQLDDKMDVASSPFRQPDDIDIDLDSVRDPSVIGSIHDDMIDDEVVQLGNSGVAQDETDEILPDDDMFDDTNPPLTTENADIDYNMDGDGEGVRLDEDEDILYEEEEDMPVEQPAQTVDEAGEVTLAEEPQDYQEADDEIDLVDFDEEHAETQQLTTNEAHVAAKQEIANITEPEPETATAVQEPLPEVENGTEQPEAGQQDDGTQDPEQAEEHHEFEDDVHAANDGTDEFEAVVPSAETIPPAIGASALAPQDNVEQQEDTEHHDPEHADKSQEVQASLHPVTLVYLDDEMSLFPPMLGDASAIYFLQDSSLAFEPLDKLLAACRDILKGTLDHHDELVLDISSLGLHICEDSKYAAQITLSQILEVYLQLCHNDGNEESPPLYCYLSSRVSLASQYAYLASACGEGKGFSEIAADYIDTPEPEVQHIHHEQGAEDDANKEFAAEEIANGQHSANTTLAVETQDASHTVQNASDGENVPEDVAPVDNHSADEAQNVDDTFGGAQAHEDQSEEATFIPDPVKEETAKAENSADVPVDDLDRQDEDPTADNVVQETRSEVSGLSHVGIHEDETNSSHTVQADHADTDVVDPDAVHFAADAEELFTDLQGQAQVSEHDPPEPELDPFSDEELFAVEEDTKDDFGDVSVSALQEAPNPASAGTNKEQQHPRPASPTSSSSQPPPAEPSTRSLKPPTGASPPITPSKSIHSKRKVEDEDDFDLLEFDTPEHKRRRPS